MLPNFLIIGAAKAGTNSLYNYIRNHPDGFMPQPKELKFFSHDEVWNKGLSWYEMKFAPGAGAVARGEASVQYSMQPRLSEVPKRVAETIPHVKLIYLVRDPIERMRSQFKHLKEVGLETDDFETAVTRPGPPGLEFKGMTPSLYVYYSLYAYQLEHYEPFFGQQQILVVKTEDLHDRRRDVLARVYSFLGMDPTWEGEVIEEKFNVSGRRRLLRPFADRLRNLRAYPQIVRWIPEVVKAPVRRVIARPITAAQAPVTPELRGRLEELFRDDVRRLSSYMDPDFDGWGLT